MRRFRNRGRCLKAVAFAGALAAAGSPRAMAIDLLYLKEPDAEPVRCEILDITDQIVRVKLSITVQGNDAYATKVIPVETIDWIDFGPLPGETLLLESATVDDLDEVEALWDERRGLLHRERSNAGEIALLFASLLLESGKPGEVRRAREIFTRIEGEDWNEARRQRARQGRLRTLIALGEIEAAVREAEEVALATEDASILMDASHVIATAEFGELKELVDDNPRWMDDDEIKPDIERRYHAVIDRFLEPSLFYGSDERLAARGLHGAVEVFAFFGDDERASARVADLAALYPGNNYTARARKLVDELTDSDKDSQPDSN